MTNNLTDISGIGAATAARLAEAGFNSIEDIANATPGKLAEASGFGEARVQKIIDAAQEMLGSEATATEGPASGATADNAAAATTVIAAAAMAPDTASTSGSSLTRPSVFIVAILLFVAVGVSASQPEKFTGMKDMVMAALTLSGDAGTETEQDAVSGSEAQPNPLTAAKTVTPPVNHGFATSAPGMPTPGITAPRMPAPAQGMPSAADDQSSPLPGNDGNTRMAPAVPYGSQGYGGNGWGNSGSYNHGFGFNYRGQGHGHGYGWPYYGYGWPAYAPYGYPMPPNYRAPAYRVPEQNKPENAG